MGSVNDVVVDQRLRIIQREYLEFLEDVEDSGIYTQFIRDMIEQGENRLIVNINDLRKKNPERASNLLENAFEEVVAFQQALKEYTASIDTTYAKEHEEVLIGFEGSFGSKHLSPRSLSAKNLGNLVCVEGIVTKCSLVRPKVVRSVHYCPETKKTLERKYTDMTSYDPIPSSGIYPTKDVDGNVLETEFGLSTYKDNQTLSMQEMPEKAPAGQLPRSVDIIVENDLVDKVKPGDRIQILGIYRCLPNKQGSFTTGTFRTILLANNVILMSKEESPHIYSDDVAKCKNFSKRKNMDVFEVLSKSLAPSIHGHEYIKKALLCMLLGGVEKVLPNGTRLRGDINILLMGDPSVAKSQLLRYVLNTAPRAITTTGRGSSGVGLTAAVTTDQETGERRLEAGAMVLADRGVVCIDEFDKMSDLDRTAIHEVMEQGRVTVSKAGIHARLNARCSVLAAANPVYGRYDQYKTPMENINLQDSLLSRFDCLFIMLDIAEPESDRKISDHVVRMHRYRAANEQDGDVLPMGMGVERLSTKNPEEDDEDEANHDTPIYEKYDALLHGNLRSKKDKIVSIKFMRKYIHIAKCIKPNLTQAASETIAEEYSRLRSQDMEHTDMARTQPITARALETLIRLSTAHAKARLSRTVDAEDAEAAIELVQFAYFKKVLEKKKKQVDADGDTESEGEEESNEDSGNKKKRKRTSVETSAKAPKKPKKKPGDEGYDPYDLDSDEELTSPKSPTAAAVRSQLAKARKSPKAVKEVEKVRKEISAERFQIFKKSLHALVTKGRKQAVEMSEFVSFLNTEHPTETFSADEIDAGVQKMTDQNQIMLTDETRQDFNIKQEIGEDIEIGEEYLGSELASDQNNKTTSDLSNDSIEDNLPAVIRSPSGFDNSKTREFSMKYSEIYNSNSKLIEGYTDVLNRKFQELNKRCVIKFESRNVKGLSSRKVNSPDLTAYAVCKFDRKTKYKFELRKAKDLQCIKGKIIESYVKCLHPDNVRYRRHIRSKDRIRMAVIIKEMGPIIVTQGLCRKSNPSAVNAGNLTDVPEKQTVCQILYEQKKRKNS